MLHNVQQEFTKEVVHLQGLFLVQFNLAEQFHLFLAQVSSLQTMILTGRMLLLPILSLILLQLIDLHFLLTHGQNFVRVIILINNWLTYLADLLTLFVSLTSSLILGQDHLNKILFQALVNSESTHYFVNSKFVDIYYLKTSATLPVALYLFDSSSNSTISKIANLPINFSTGDYMNLDFYITLLDFSCSLVLRYNWLAQHNLLID